MTREAINHISTQSALAVSTNAVSLTLPTQRAGHAIIFVSGAPIRWTGTDTAPTATTGMFAAADSYLEFMQEGFDYADFLRRFQAIRDTTAGGDASLFIAYFT